MRGVAALSAALAVWVVLGGKIPAVRLRSMSLPTMRDVGMAASWGVGGFAVSFTLSGLIVVAVVVAVLVASAWLSWRRIAGERVRRDLTEQWPDLLAVLRSRLAAGKPLPDATIEAAFHRGGPLEQFGRNVELMLRQGVSFQAALERERIRLRDPIADRVLSSLSFASQAGGGRVADILGLLGRSVSDELRVRRAHEAALTQQRLTAGVAVAAPWALLLLTVATNPQAASAYEAAAGVRVVLIGLAMTLLGFVLVRRSARLSRPARIFR